MSNSPLFVVSNSGGLGSFEALRRTIEKHGKECVVSVFSDVGTVIEGGIVVSGEDVDLHRFMDETDELLGIHTHRIRSSKYTGVWDAFFKRRFMGNTLVDVCSEELKRNVLDQWIAENAPAARRVIGYSWLEQDRVEPFLEYFPDAIFPLRDPPYVLNDEIGEWLLARGVKPPKIYGEGFVHNNCGGFCVKMGLGQLYRLWKHRPERYEYNERKEREFREKIGTPCTIFRRDNEGFTMEQLRHQFEDGYRPRTYKDSGCGGRCMVPTKKPC